MIEGPKQFVTVFRVIDQHFESNPELFATEGLFRQSGGHTRVQAVISQIYHDSKFKTEDNFTAHECIGALKIAFGEEAWLLPTHQCVLQLATFIKNVDIKNTEPLPLIRHSFDEFFEELIKSKSEDDNALAEAIFCYCYLIKRTHQFCDVNKMSAKNLAIILAPVLMNNVLSTDQMTMIIIHSKITTILEKLIESDFFSQPFHLKYNQALLNSVQHKCQDRDQQLSKLSAVLTLHTNAIFENNLKIVKLNKAIQALSDANVSLQANKKRISREEYRRQCHEINDDMKNYNEELSQLKILIDASEAIINESSQERDLCALELHSMRRSLSSLELAASELSSQGSSSSGSSPSATPSLPEDIELELQNLQLYRHRSSF